MADTICPWGLTGRGGGLYYYYCVRCLSTGGWIPAGGLASPVWLSSIGYCGNPYCFPAVGTMPAPSPQAPVARAYAARQGGPIAPSKLLPGRLGIPFGQQFWESKYPDHEPLRKGLKQVTKAFDPVSCPPYGFIQVITQAWGKTERGLEGVQLMRGVYSNVLMWNFGQAITPFSKAWPQVTFTHLYDRIYQVEFNGFTYDVVMGR